MKLSLLFCVLICLSCNNQIDSTGSKDIFVDTTKPFKKEIPLSLNGKLDLFYTLGKAKQIQLGLDSLENGFPNLQIRIWYDFSLVKNRKLLVISNTDAGWKAEGYNLTVDWNGHTETILSKSIKSLLPKSNWSKFSKKLLDLKILTLPESIELPGYEFGDDGTTYNVEIATKNQYRFYGYWEPKMNQNIAWQAKNMTEILKLVKEELAF